MEQQSQTGTWVSGTLLAHRWGPSGGRLRGQSGGARGAWVPAMLPAEGVPRLPFRDQAPECGLGPGRHGFRPWPVPPGASASPRACPGGSPRTFPSAGATRPLGDCRRRGLSLHRFAGGETEAHSNPTRAAATRRYCPTPPTHTHSTRHPCDVRTPPWAPSHGAWTAEGRGVPRVWRVRGRSAQASGTPEEHAPDRSRLRGWWGVGSRGGEGQGGNEAMRGEAGRGHRAPTPPAWRLLCPAEGRAISRPPARKAWAPGPSWGLQYHHFTSSPFEQEGRS